MSFYTHDLGYALEHGFKPNFSLGIPIDYGEQNVAILDHDPIPGTLTGNVMRLETVRRDGVTSVEAHGALETVVQPFYDPPHWDFGFDKMFKMMECVRDEKFDEARKLCADVCNRQVEVTMETTRKDPISEACSNYEHALFSTGAFGAMKKETGIHAIALLNPSPGTISRCHVHFGELPVYVTGSSTGDYTHDEYRKELISRMASCKWKGLPLKVPVSKLPTNLIYYCGFSPDVGDRYKLEAYIGLELNPYILQVKGNYIAEAKLEDDVYSWKVVRKGYAEYKQYAINPSGLRYLPDVVDVEMSKHPKFQERYINGIFNVLCSHQVFRNNHFMLVKDSVDLVDCEYAHVTDVTYESIRQRGRPYTVCLAKNSDGERVIVDVDDSTSYSSRAGVIASLLRMPAYKSFKSVEFTKEPKVYNIIKSPVVTSLVYSGGDTEQFNYALGKYSLHKAFRFAKCTVCHLHFHRDKADHKCVGGTIRQVAYRMKYDSASFLPAFRHALSHIMVQDTISNDDIPRYYVDCLIRDTVQPQREFKVFTTQFLDKRGDMWYHPDPDKYVQIDLPHVGIMTRDPDGTVFCMHVDVLRGVYRGVAGNIKRLPYQPGSMSMTLTERIRSTAEETGFIWQNLVASRLAFSPQKMTYMDDDVV